MAVLNTLDKFINEALGGLVVNSTNAAAIWKTGSLEQSQYITGPIQYPEFWVNRADQGYTIGPLLYEDYIASAERALEALSKKTQPVQTSTADLDLGNTDTVIPVGQGTLDKTLPGYTAQFPEHTYDPYNGSGSGGSGGGNTAYDDRVKTTEELAKANIDPKRQPTQPIKDGGFVLLTKNQINGNKINPDKGWNIPSNAAFRANASDKFVITYKNRKDGTQRKFTFDLLPAIENRGGSKFGNIEVPEVKPGVLQRIDTKHKNIVIPGSTPVVQTIGINNAMLNLIGCMTGEDIITIGAAEPLSGRKSKGDVLMGNYQEPFDKDVSATKQARLFMDEVALPGTEVDVLITASNNGASAPLAGEGPEIIKYTGVIISYKFYAVRKNKAFYTIDLLVTQYPK